MIRLFCQTASDVRTRSVWWKIQSSSKYFPIQHMTHKRSGCGCVRRWENKTAKNEMFEGFSWDKTQSLEENIGLGDVVSDVEPTKDSLCRLLKCKEDKLLPPTWLRRGKKKNEKSKSTAKSWRRSTIIFVSTDDDKSVFPCQDLRLMSERSSCQRRWALAAVKLEFYF